MISSRIIAPTVAPMMMTPRLTRVFDVAGMGGIVIRAAGTPSSKRHWETEKLECS